MKRFCGGCVKGLVSRAVAWLIVKAVNWDYVERESKRRLEVNHRMRPLQWHLWPNVTWGKLKRWACFLGYGESGH